MIIKVKLEGELLECLKRDSADNLRTHPAQIIYYLRQIYAEQLGITLAPSIDTVVPKISAEDLTLVKESPKGATIVREEEPLVPSQEPEDKTTGYGIHKDDKIDIPDDILNF